MHNEVMDFDRFRRETKTDIFDYQLLESYLRGLSKPRDKVMAFVSEGKLVRIKKGLYAFGENWRHQPICLELVANLLYGPSCISFEFALSYYGLIAERSVVITSLTIGKTKSFDTPLGLFEYRAIDREKFKVGIEYKTLGNPKESPGGYFLASREKALADLVYRTPGIRTREQLRHYLFEEMRVDEEMFRELDFKRLEEIARIYQKKSVQMMGQL
jgi:predicted transcriptional regulator of viral defense system